MNQPIGCGIDHSIVSPICHCHYESYKDVPSEKLKWAIDLVFDNMREIYLKSHFLTTKRQKTREMTCNQSKYIFINDHEPTPLGFIHYQLTKSDDPEVPMYVYCYELQIRPESQKKGLGRLLMHLLEQYTLKKHHRDGICLTVQSKNDRAIKFYKSLEYEFHSKSESFFVMIKKVAFECPSCQLMD